METRRQYHRPPYEDALSAWKALLKERGFSTDLLWILEENLCFERDPNDLAGVTLGFQTQFTPQPADAAKVTYHHFAEMDARLAFYRLGENRGHSICIQLCDPWRERVVRGRPLSAVDFCMTLAALRELKAHGRVLTPDERFGLKILRSMQGAV